MRKPSRSNGLRPPVSETMMSSKRRCTRGRRRAGQDPVADQLGDRAGAVVLLLRDARDIRGCDEEVGVDPRGRRLARGAAQPQRAVEAVPVALRRDVGRRAAHRLAGHVRPGRAPVPAREQVPHRGGLVGRPAGNQRGAAEAGSAPREALADQVPADGGRRDPRGRGELPEPVHEQDEPSVPVGRHLDLVDAAAEPPEVGARAGERLERRVVQGHSLRLGPHLDGGRQKRREQGKEQGSVRHRT